MKFEFTQDEANVLLAALAKEPFQNVYQVIAKLQKQAAAQLAPKTKKVKNDNPI